MSRPDEASPFNPDEDIVCQFAGFEMVFNYDPDRHAIVGLNRFPPMEDYKHGLPAFHTLMRDVLLKEDVIDRPSSAEMSEEDNSMSFTCHKDCDSAHALDITAEFIHQLGELENKMFRDNGPPTPDRVMDRYRKEYEVPKGSWAASAAADPEKLKRRHKKEKDSHTPSPPHPAITALRKCLMAYGALKGDTYEDIGKIYHHINLRETVLKGRQRGSAQLADELRDKIEHAITTLITDALREDRKSDAPAIVEGIMALVDAGPEQEKPGQGRRGA